MSDWVLAEQNHQSLRRGSGRGLAAVRGAEPHKRTHANGRIIFSAEVGAGMPARVRKGRERGCCCRGMPFGVNTNHLQVPGALG